MSAEDIYDDPIVGMLWGPGVDSATRLGRMLEALDGEQGPSFWRPFSAVWSDCDDTWNLQAELLAAIDHAGEGWQDAMDPETTAAWFNALPNMLTIYRGCSVARVFGPSWSTNQAIAVGFARGHRGLRNPDPVVVTARVSKRAVLFATNDRKEAEVLVYPGAIKHFTMRPLWFFERCLDGGRSGPAPGVQIGVQGP